MTGISSANLALFTHEGETDLAWEAFALYCHGGAGYSLARLASDHFAGSPGKLRLLERWSSDFDWVKRRAAYLTEVSAARAAYFEDVNRQCLDLMADNALGVTQAAITAVLKSADPRLVKLLFDSLGVGRKADAGASVSFEFNASNLNDAQLANLLEKLKD